VARGTAAHRCMLLDSIWEFMAAFTFSIEARRHLT